MCENDKIRIMAATLNSGLQWRHLAAVLVTVLGCWTVGVSATRKVTTAPHIFEQPAEFETAYKPGEDVRLPCVADTNSEPNYSWKKNDRPLTVNDGRVIMQHPYGTIIIKTPTQEDDGVYQCFASNQFGTSVTIKTSLKKAFVNPFKTVTSPTVHRVEIGHYLTLRCTPPESYPRGSVYWGISRPEATRLTSIETNDRVLLDYEGNLHFANLLSADDTENSSSVCVCNIFNKVVRATLLGEDQSISCRVPEGHLRIANVIQDDSLFDDSVSYVCIVNNQMLGTFVQGDDQKINPFVQAGSPVHRPPAKMWTSPSTDIAIKGRNKKIKCIFSGLPTPKVTWTRLGGKPMGSRTNESIEGHGTELEFINVDFDDAGTYRCSATNEVDGTPVTADINLTVHAAPYWRQNKPPADRQVDEEDDVEFICQADGTPPPTIAWYINGVPHAAAPSNPRRRVEGNKVIYRGVVTADAAVLQCVATNEYGHIVANTILTVNAAAPSFSVTPDDQKIVEGGNAVFSCRVYAAPKPRIEWKKGSNPVSSDRLIVHSSGDLEITNARLADNGTYFCHASNKLGRDYVAANLLVRSPTRITDPPSSQSVNATDDVTLNCGASTDRAENLTVEWRRDGRPIDFRSSSPHFRYNPRDHSLVISGSRVGDSGQYTCHASNGLDSVDSPPAKIVVKDRPAAPGSVQIKCTTRYADITWETGSDNNDPIVKFVVYYRERSAASSGQMTQPVDRKQLQIGANLTRTVNGGGTDEYGLDDEEERQATVAVIPWRQYEFYVTAWNGLGESDLSAASPSSTCRTPETAPTKNPTGVCSRLQAARQLVIVWEPLTEKELNGPGFYYLISYKLRGSTGAPETTRVDNSTISEVVVHQREIFRKYEISVQAANAVGISTASVGARIGYSGEGRPVSAPTNFELLKDSLNSTYAEFSWDPIDPSPERVQGFFRGYRIIMWRANDPNNKRFEDIILYRDFDTCPDFFPDQFRKRRHMRSAVAAGGGSSGLLLQRAGRDAARQQQQQQQQPVVAGTNQLWPYSRIHAAVAVLNSENEGYPSDPAIVFQTPEGVAGAVGSLKVNERGSNHLVVEWTRPIEPNGIITSFVVVCRVAPPNVGHPREILISSPLQLTETIRDLESLTLYRISVSAVTVAGRGESIFVDGQTLQAAPPDKPLIGSIDAEDTTVLVTFSPSTVNPATNPGTVFYVEYIDTDKEDDGGPWNRTQPTVGPKAVNITNLEPGSAYKFRVVAVNGIGETQRETRSDPYTVHVGDHGLITFEPPRTIYTDGPGVGPIIGGTEPSLVHASSAWFIILMIIILLLLLILLIVCIVRRTRGEMYPVQEKEKLWGRDPLAPDDKPFGEYTASGGPDPARSRGSLDSEEKPLDSGSETDSLGEYEDPEASKFNEDGSFIGLYSGQKSRPGGGGGGGGGRNTRPEAANTFV